MYASTAYAPPNVTTATFEKNGQRYQAVALPGNDTQDVGACQLVETDLEVPVPGDTRISLTRHFHSFFQPTEVTREDLPAIAPSFQNISGLARQLVTP